MSHPRDIATDVYSARSLCVPDHFDMHLHMLMHASMHEEEKDIISDVLSHLMAEVVMRYDFDKLRKMNVVDPTIRFYEGVLLVPCNWRDPRAIISTDDSWMQVSHHTYLLERRPRCSLRPLVSTLGESVEDAMLKSTIVLPAVHDSDRECLVYRRHALYFNCHEIMFREALDRAKTLRDEHDNRRRSRD